MLPTIARPPIETIVPLVWRDPSGIVLADPGEHDPVEIEVRLNLERDRGGGVGDGFAGRRGAQPALRRDRARKRGCGEAKHCNEQGSDQHGSIARPEALKEG
jgi:hypothetical protein